MHFFKRTVAAFMVSALTAALLSGCFGGREVSAPEQTEAAATTAPAHRPREGIQTILISCLKQLDKEKSTGDFRNGSKSDMIMLMVIDEKLGKTTALQLNPDTMVLLSVPGMAEEREMPLSEVYSYGSGGSDSCIYQSKAVSQLLDRTPIDHYMTLTLDAIGVVNDIIGGIDVEILDAFPEEYPQFVKGEQIHLSGADAIAFFDFRDETDVTNLAHMQRQQQYMAAIYSPFTASMQEENFLTRLTMQLGDGLATDLALSQMVQMMDLMNTCKLDENILTLSGTSENVDGQFLFRADPNSIERILSELLY